MEYVYNSIHSHYTVRSFKDLRIRTYVHTVDAKLKFPFRIRSTLRRVITEDTLEPCHLRLVLSTSLIALALAAVSITNIVGLVDNTRRR